VADGLALPGFTFGLDWILLIGRLRLSEHLTLDQTLDQTHQAVQERLVRYQVTISRREVLYLFEAYCSLLRAAQGWRADPPWRAAVEANGGLLLALDGVQPDKGQERPGDDLSDPRLVERSLARGAAPALERNAGNPRGVARADCGLGRAGAGGVE
jgi:hypothetical protein